MARMGLLWKIERNICRSAENNSQALPRTLAAPTVTPSSRRLRRHHRHPCRFLRLPLRPRLALAAGGHRQPPTDQEGLRRGTLDEVCACAMLRPVSVGKVGTAVQSIVVNQTTTVNDAKGYRGRGNFHRELCKGCGERGSRSRKNRSRSELGASGGTGNGTGRQEDSAIPRHNKDLLRH